MMDSFAETLNGFGRWLVGRLWQMSIELAILAVVVVAVILLLRIRSPRLRHLFWCLVLAKPVAVFVIASPLSLYWFLRPEVRQPERAVAALPATPAAGEIQPGTVRWADRFRSHRGMMGPGPDGPEPATLSPEPVTLDRYGAAAAAWLAVASLLGLRLVVGFAYVAFLRQTAAPQRRGPLADIVAEASRALKTRRRVRLALSDVAHGPVLAGVLRPVILLPRRLTERLSPEQMKLVVSHELAHLRRHDNLLLLVQRLAEMLLFFHPVVWLCGWAMRREAEAACDDAVVAAHGKTAAYADSLTRVAEMHSGLTRRLLVNTFAAAESDFPRRVRRILKRRAGRMTLGLSIASAVALVLIGCLGLPTAAERKAKPTEAGKPEEKGKPMAAPDMKYGFRYDPMQWAEQSSSLHAAMVRTFVLKRPKPTDAKYLQREINKILTAQRSDGSFGDTAKDTGSRLEKLLELGYSPDKPEVGRAADAILRQARAGKTGEEEEASKLDGRLLFSSVRALCLAGRTEAPEVRATLQWLVQHTDRWVGRGCPWTPAAGLKTLWAGRDVVDTSAALTSGLQWVADNLSAAGCLFYWDPWSLLDCAGTIDHPLCRRIVEKQIPMILRAQRPDGGWPDMSPATENSFTVLRALNKHGLLKKLCSLPAQPADWKVVRSIPAPKAALRNLAWDGRWLWTVKSETKEAVALSPEDGRLLKTVKLPAGNLRGFGWWDGALAVTQGSPWKKDPKRLLKVDPETGAVRKQVPLDDLEHVGGVGQVDGKLWLVDSFYGWISIADPTDPEKRTKPRELLPGPLPIDVTPAGKAVWHQDIWAPWLIKSDLSGRFLDCGERPFEGFAGLAWDGRALWALDSKNNRICVIEKTETGKQLSVPDGKGLGAVMATTDRPAGTVKREGGKVWVEGVKGWQMGQKGSSIHATQAAIMQAIGEEITYEQLVGASGLAFRMQVHKELCPSSPHSFCGFQCVAGSNRALPWKLRVFEVKGDDAKGVAEARQAIAASIDRGVPVQYGSEEDGVIVGYQNGGAEWLCIHPMRGGGKTFVEKKWPWGIAVFTERKAGVPTRRELAIDALKQAVQMAHATGSEDYLLGFHAWDLWLKRLAELEQADEKTRNASMTGNSWIYTTLVEYRGIAAKYLQSVAGEFQDETAGHLKAAAALYDKMANQVLTSEGSCALDIAPRQRDLKAGQKWNQAMRQEQVKRLTAALALEKQAIAEIEKALAAEGVKLTASATEPATP